MNQNVQISENYKFIDPRSTRNPKQDKTEKQHWKTSKSNS